MRNTEVILCGKNNCRGSGSLLLSKCKKCDGPTTEGYLLCGACALINSQCQQCACSINISLKRVEIIIVSTLQNASRQAVAEAELEYTACTSQHKIAIAALRAAETRLSKLNRADKRAESAHRALKAAEAALSEARVKQADIDKAQSSLDQAQANYEEVCRQVEAAQAHRQKAFERKYGSTRLIMQSAEQERRKLTNYAQGRLEALVRLMIARHYTNTSFLKELERLEQAAGLGEDFVLRKQVT